MFCPLHAQDSDRTTLGVSFSSDITYQEILDALPELKKLGINVIEVAHPTPKELIEEISNYSFDLYVRNDAEFLSETALKTPDFFEKQLLPVVELYTNNSSITGIGLLSNSERLDQNVILALRSKIPDSSNVFLYEVNSIGNPFSLSIANARKPLEQTKTTHYVFDLPFHPKDIQLIKEIFKSHPTTLLFSYHWLQTALESKSYLRPALLAYANSNDKSILLPNENTSMANPISDWAVIFFIALWLSTGFHIQLNPTYKAKISRYFISHRFYVDDILQFRDREASSGITIFIQHSFFTGLVAYILSITFITDRGLGALYEHLPYLSILGTSYFSLFTWSVLLTLLISVFGMIWAYLPNKEVRHFSQIINLYVWIFHIDFIIVSIILVLGLTESSPTGILIFTSLHIFCWLLAFIFSVYDSSRHMFMGRSLYFFKTLGLFTIVLIVFIVALIFYPNSIDVLKLATHL